LCDWTRSALLVQKNKPPSDRFHYSRSSRATTRTRPNISSSPLLKNRNQTSTSILWFSALYFSLIAKSTNN
jgi:hypothetical protein